MAAGDSTQALKGYSHISGGQSKNKPSRTMPFMYQASRRGARKPRGEGGEKDQGVVIAQTKKVSIDGGRPREAGIMQPSARIGPAGFDIGASSYARSQ